MMIQRMWGGSPSLMVGAALGLLVSAFAPVVVDSARDVYDDSHPVWSDVSITSIRRDAEAVIVGLYGTRHRHGCRFLRMNAVSVRADGNQMWGQITREDAPMTGATRDLGPQPIGVFRVVPVWPDAVAIKLTAEHECSGRHLVTPIKDIRL